jgi:hypothetical protein
MKRINNHALQVFLVSCLFIAFFSCTKEIDQPAVSPAEEFSKKPNDPGFASNDMVMFWNERTAVIFGATVIQPTRARRFAITQIAVHDALNNIKPKYERFALNEREQFADPDAAVASAAHRAITGLGRGNAQVDYWRDSCLATIPDGESKTLGIALGIKSANAILANRANDGFTQVIISSPNPPDGDEPGEYRSTLRFVTVNGVATLVPFDVKNIPNWGTVVRPFVVESNSQFRPAGPDAVNSAAYTADYEEVKQKGANQGGVRTANEETLARFWSESRPSIIWNNFARNLIAGKKMDAWKTARLFALMHTAMADGINTVMNSNYYFYSWRPETAVRLAGTDGNASTSPNANWLPFLAEAPGAFYTPPVPQYPSSFGTYGGVASSILQSFFGSDDISIELNSFTLPGTTLHYNSIAQAARDNTLSKVWSGWDFRKAAIDGEEMGRQIGNYVFTHQFREN